MIQLVRYTDRLPSNTVMMSPKLKLKEGTKRLELATSLVLEFLSPVHNTR
jgi:hypothetical protein